MESFKADTLKKVAHEAISQSGKGVDIDRQIYSMQGEGLGSIFGSLAKSAIPMLGKAIRGAARIAKPHVIAAGKDLIDAGTKRGIEEVNKKLVHNSHKRPRQAKWQSL